MCSGLKLPSAERVLTLAPAACRADPGQTVAQKWNARVTRIAPSRSQRAAAPLRRLRIGEARNPGPEATHDATGEPDSALTAQRHRPAFPRRLMRTSLPPLRALCILLARVIDADLPDPRPGFSAPRDGGGHTHPGDGQTGSGSADPLVMEPAFHTPRGDGGGHPPDTRVEPEARHASRRRSWPLNEPERREGAGAISEAETLSDTLSPATPVAAPQSSPCEAPINRRRARVRHALEQMRLVPPPSREPPTERPPPTTALAARASEPHAPIEEPGGLCCVCLEALHLYGSGEHAAAPFPTCTRHYLHVGCLAQFRVQASTASELLCPLCRHSRCPDCDPHGWGSQHDAAVREACAREGVPMPSRLTGEDTVRGAVRDYALRTFTGNDALEPPPPPGVSVLCCNRIAAVAAAGGVDFVSLPHRAMQWAPVPIRHEAGIAAWQPGWVCPGCAEELRLADLDIPVDAGQGEREKLIVHRNSLP